MIVTDNKYLMLKRKHNSQSDSKPNKRQKKDTVKKRFREPTIIIAKKWEEYTLDPEIVSIAQHFESKQLLQLVIKKNNDIDLFKMEELYGKLSCMSIIYHLYIRVDVLAFLSSNDLILMKDYLKYNTETYVNDY